MKMDLFLLVNYKRIVTWEKLRERCLTQDEMVVLPLPPLDQLDLSGGGGGGAGRSERYAKTPLFEPYICINDHFTKTGSGQT